MAAAGFAALLILLTFHIIFCVTAPALRRILARTGFDAALVNMLVGV